MPNLVKIGWVVREPLAVMNTGTHWCTWQVSLVVWIVTISHNRELPKMLRLFHLLSWKITKVINLLHKCKFNKHTLNALFGNVFHFSIKYRSKT
jgi:hypothetical protein